MASKVKIALKAVGVVGVGALVWDFVQYANPCGEMDNPKFKAKMETQLEGFEQSSIERFNYLAVGDYVRMWYNENYQDGEPKVIAVQELRDSSKVCMYYAYE